MKKNITIQSCGLAGTVLMATLGLVGGCLVLISGCSEKELPPADPSKPINILLLINDAWRQDTVGCYNEKSHLTPHINAFAKRSAVFQTSVAQSSCTINSSPSMFFGLYPSEHQYYNYKQRVSDQWVAIAELLRNKAGYKTYGLSTNPHVSKRNGLAQGFDVFISPKGWSKAPAGTVNERFKTWAGDIEQDRFFAMLWYTDTHVPYNPPESIKRKFLAPEDWNHLGKNTTSPTTYDSNRKQQEVGKKLYFASVSYFDREFGKLIAFLEEAQLLKNTAIILTSDHGEALGDHKIGSERAVFGHCSSLRAPQVEIPLIIYLPWLDRQVEVTTPAQSIDLYPTLRDLARITSGPDYPLAGRSLLPSISRQTEDPERLLFTELITTAYTPINKRGVRRGDFGLVYTYIRGKKTYNPPRVTEVFFGDKDTLSDAQKPDHDALKADLSKQYQAWTEQVERTRFPSEKAEFKSTRDRKTLEKQLRALGYVQ